jgi:hypothetical protein
LPTYKSLPTSTTYQIPDVFSHWNKDTPTEIQACLQYDIDALNLNDVLNSPEDEPTTRQILKPFYECFMKIHTVLAAHTQYFPLVDRELCHFFVFKSSIIVRDTNINLDDAMKLFEQVNNDEPLNRFQFLEFVLRLVR